MLGPSSLGMDALKRESPSNVLTPWMREHECLGFVGALGTPLHEWPEFRAVRQRPVDIGSPSLETSPTRVPSVKVTSDGDGHPGHPVVTKPTGTSVAARGCALLSRDRCRPRTDVVPRRQTS